MNLAVALLALMLANGSKNSAASKPRRRFVGKSANVWFVVDSIAGASKTPVVDVFQTATGNDLVISFAVLPGGIRALIFRSPSTLALPAIADFDVNDRAKAGKL